MRMKAPLIFGILCLTLCLGPISHASVSATGEFKATKACQAYQSMRRKTNPGCVRLEIGRSYPIFELNVPRGTTWYRLRVDNANPSERWVYFECGDVDLSSKKEPQPGGGQGTPGGGGKCNTPGEADSFVFAVSWQPAFCESHRDKPECSVDDPASYQANNFTLHGLWPNKQSCGTKYGFCGKYQKTVRPFCNYDKVPMQPETLEKLGKVMPSAAHGSCLQRHEWYKHGTCQTKRDANGYFDLSMRLLKEFNDSGVADFMQSNIGRTVTTESFFDVVDQAFQEGAHKRLQISCRSGKLVDIYIQLPNPISQEASLPQLLKQAEPKFRNGCGERFEVDAIGQ